MRVVTFGEVACNPRVVPPSVRQFSLHIDPNEASGLEQEYLRLRLPAKLEDAVPRRRRQFVAGRACAAEALRALGIVGDAVLPQRADGAPEWPDGVSGSITHTDDFASAAVARTDEVAELGIDSETVLSEERARRVAATIAWPFELAQGRAAGLTRLEAVTLAFSAKEATYKCLARRVGRVFEFHDVRIVAIDGAARTFRVRVVAPLSAAVPYGTMLNGQFDIDGTRVHTGITLRHVAHHEGS
jgi:enterobactin synthetase component D